MAKRRKILLALFLSVSLMMSSVVPAFASETTEPQVTGTGTLDDPTVTVTEETKTTDEGHKSVVTVTVTEGKGTDSSGAQVKQKEKTVVEEITRDDGVFIQQSGISEGSETSVAEKTEDVEAVTVDVTPGKENTGSSTPAETTTTGDLKEDDADMDYDQTTTSETPREVKVTAEDVIITEEQSTGDTSLQSPIPDASLIDANVPDKDIQKHEYNPKEYDSGNPGGFDYRYTDYGQESSIEVNKKNSNDDTVVHHFELTDVNDATKKQYVYCSDYNTSALRGYYYDVKNLETSTYYDEDEKDHIRAIVEYGYWGPATGKGSLTELKKSLEADVLAGKLVDFGIDDLTEGEALTATQAAIWYFANGGNSVDYSDPAGNGGDDDSSDRVKALVDYLLTLTKSKDEATATQIINDKNFLKEDSMKLTVKDKVEDAAENKDDNDKNDVYNTDFTFALTVIPNAVSDDLLVIVSDSNGNVVKTVRIAGENKDGEDYTFLTPNADGSYTIKDIKLGEGNAAFDLRLQGMQYLEEGVYIYTSEEYNETNSQTFVGIAEGSRTVDVSMRVSFNFEVDEGEVITSREWQHIWIEYGTEELNEEEEIEEEEEEEEEEEIYKKDSSDRPKTGDASSFLLLFANASSLAIAGTVIGYKKRRK